MLGELVGFLPPALMGVGLSLFQVPEAVLVFGLTLAGCCEGLILGQAQARVIRGVLPEVAGWTRATAIAAGIAWLAGMGGSSLVQALGMPALAVAVPGWIVGLLAMGVLQAGCLRGHVPNAHRWIPVTSFAWLVGVMIPVLALSAVPNTWPLVAHVVVADVAAVLMGATVGLLTGRTLARFVDARDLAEQKTTS